MTDSSAAFDGAGGGWGRRLRIAVDVDGVLADHVTPLCAAVRQRSGLTLRPADLETFDLPLPGEETTVQAAVDERLADSPYLARLTPIPGAAHATRTLRAAGHELWIATHRPAHTHATTKEWLTRRGIEYDRYLDAVPSNKGRIDADLLIDDYHGNVTDALAEGMDAALFLQPWNRLYSGILDAERIVTDWDDALERLVGDRPNEP